MPKWNEFDDREWNRIEETWCAWWEGELDRPLLFIESVPLESGVVVSNLTPHLTQHGLDTPVEEFMTQIEGCLRQVEYLGDAFPKWFPNLGAGVLAAFLGSQPHFDNDTTWFNPVDDREMANLEMEIDPSNPWWVRLGRSWKPPNGCSRVIMCWDTQISAVTWIPWPACGRLNACSQI
jgi:hypothetical protein